MRGYCHISLQYYNAYIRAQKSLRKKKFSFVLIDEISLHTIFARVRIIIV